MPNVTLNKEVELKAAPGQDPFGNRQTKRKRKMKNDKEKERKEE